MPSWDAIHLNASKSPAFRGRITRVSVHSADGTELAELTDEIDGIALGGAEMEVVKSGVGTRLTIRTEEGDTVDFPMSKAVHRGEMLRVST